ncbi:MAG: branched chain amino acid ABC transporter substrate-binding protein [Chloroflexi bacterium GWC2_73_18]|nr:MAG: branched chain amino acid ABC transporter substrate-binding protein [Chloroflexi bacterium GWC2_73_18]
MRLISRLGVLLVGAAVVAAACQGGGGQKFTIGFGGTLTGEFAAFATNMQKGAQLAIDEINAAGGINGVQVEMISVDDRGEPKEGPVVAQQFCDNKAVSVVLGYSFSSVALPAVPIYDQCQMPVLASAVTSPKLSGSSKYFHRNVPTDAYQGAQMGEYAAKILGLKQIASLHQVDDYGNGVTEAFENAFKGAGGEIVSSDGYQLGTKDFLPILTNVQQKNPDGIFIGGFYPEDAKIAQQARGLGMQQPILGTDGAANPELIQLGGDAVEGLVFYATFDPTIDLPAVKKFVDAYKAKFNEEPNSWAALAYDAVYTVKKAAELAGGNSRDKIQTGLGMVKDLPGVTGTTTFDQSGDRAMKLLFIAVKDGKFALAEKQP